MSIDTNCNKAPEGWLQSDLAQIGWTFDGYNFVAPKPSAITAEEIRSDRDAKLLQSDWTQTEDAPVDKTAWKIYRQALRDITAQPGFPEAVIWPQRP